MNAWRSVWGPMRLWMPARRARRRTIRPAAMAIKTCAVAADEDRPFASLTDGEVDGPGGAGRQRDGDGLAALADDRQGAVAAFEPERSMSAPIASDTRSPFNARQADEGMVAGAAETGGDEQGADFVAVKAGGVRLVVQARPTDMHGR